MKMHKFLITQKPGSDDEIMRGSNVQVFMDGEPVLGISSIAFRVDARGIAKLKIEMYANVEIDGVIELGNGDPSDV